MPYGFGITRAGRWRGGHARWRQRLCVGLALEPGWGQTSVGVRAARRRMKILSRTAPDLRFAESHRERAQELRIAD
jgi:hypothetical protein